MLNENDYPISVRFDAEMGIFSPCQQELLQGNKLIYEIRYYPFITSKSDMALGVTRIFPGKVGDEYHMTKGHIHERDDQPEIYYCVQGSGYLLLDTLQGQFRAEKWEPGVITHIPPMWAHRVVNTGSDLLVFVASYNISAGHEYSRVEQQGFAQILVERDNQPTFLTREALV